MSGLVYQHQFSVAPVFLIFLSRHGSIPSGIYFLAKSLFSRACSNEISGYVLKAKVFFAVKTVIKAKVFTAFGVYK
jgi:hypothetical protein